MNMHPADRLAAIKAQMTELAREDAALRQLLQSGHVSPCGEEWVAQFQVRARRFISVPTAERTLPGAVLATLVDVKKQVVLHLLRVGDLRPGEPAVEPDTGEREAA